MSPHLAINLESIFGLAAVLLLIRRSDTHPPLTSRLIFGLRDAIPMLIIAAMICTAFWQASRSSFLSDDYVLVSMSQSLSGNYAAIFTHGGGDGFFRPLGYVSIWWTWPVAGLDPVRWHWVALTLHVANALLVYILGGMIGLSRGYSWFASALFAWHGAHPEAALWIAGRFDLLSTFFALLALVAFIKLWEETLPVRRWIWGVVALVAMGLGMLSKESAYAAPLMMLVFVASRPSSPSSSWTRRLRFLAPFFLLTAVLFAYRWHLQGGIGGYLGAGGQPQALSLNFLAMGQALALRLWAVLFFPINWAIPAGTWLVLATGLYAAAWIALALTIRGSRRQLLLPLGFVLVAALPAVQQLLIGADLEKSRLVYLPSAGFCLLAASVVSMVTPKLGYVAGFAILAFQLAALLHNLTGWESAAAKSKIVCEVVSKCSNPASVVGLPRSINGVYFFANGLPECVRMEQATHPDQPLHSCSLSWDPATAGLKGTY